MEKAIPFSNPYIVQGAVKEPSLFFGRRDLLAWIEGSLEEGRWLLVVEGLYGMGKSSLLCQLGSYLGDGYAVVRVGVKEIAGKSLDPLLWQIASLMGGEGIGLPGEEEFHPSHFKEEFLPRLSKVAGGKPILLALDDLDSLEGELCSQLLSCLKASDLRLLLTWEAPPDCQGSLAEALVWRLGPLPREEATRLINEPAARVLHYDYEAQERIFELTSGYPYLIQLLCHALFERCVARGRVLLKDVEEAIPEAMGLAQGYMERILSASSPEEQKVLAAIGGLRGIQGLILEEEVRYFLQRKGISLPDLEATFQRLEKRGFLEKLSPATYRFRFDILRRWLGREERLRVLMGDGGAFTRTRRRSLQGFLWPAVAILAISGLFLWSLLSRTQPPPPGGGMTPQEATPATPTGSTAAAASLLSPTPARPEIAFMSWEGESGTWEIYLMASDGSNQIRLTENEVNDAWPSWSYDGSRLLFVSERDGNKEIYLMKVDGSEPIDLSRHPDPDNTPSFSPDGTEIVFTSYRDGNWEIYLMDADGSHQARLTINEVPDYSPVWSPDGTKIAFVSQRDGDMEIYVMEMKGGLSEEVKLTDDEATDGSPAWSPDGTKIAFESYRDGDMEIYIMNADGSGQVNLTNDHTADDHGPSWGPEGTKIVYYSNRDRNWEIYTINLDGTGRANLTGSPEEEQGPAWRPRVW